MVVVVVASFLHFRQVVVVVVVVACFLAWKRHEVGNRKLWAQGRPHHTGAIAQRFRRSLSTPTFSIAKSTFRQVVVVVVVASF